MSAATANTDPFAVFAAAADASESNDSHASQNPFDPLGAAAPADKKASSGADPLDLMSQISSWGAENHTEDETKKEEPAAATPVSPTSNKNVMATKAGAIELSDDLVAEAHRAFEATEDQLRKFDQAQ